MSYRIPVKIGLLDKNFVNDLKADGTFNEDSFGREYESLWSGQAEGSFFSVEAFEKNREIKTPEYEPAKRLLGTKDGNPGEYYMAVDVGRLNDQTVINIIRNQPVKNQIGIKKVVNMKVVKSEAFEKQALEIKREVLKWNPKQVTIDGNGLGIGLIDCLVRPSLDPDTQEELPALGVINDEKREYKNIDTGGNIIPRILYILKADSTLNKIGYTNLLAQMASSKVKFLVNEREAKESIPKSIQNSGSLAVNEYLEPFYLTSALETELLNLTKADTEQFKLVPMSKSIGKDKVSALMYNLYAIKEIEDKERLRKKRNMADFLIIN